MNGRLTNCLYVLLTTYQHCQNLSDYPPVNMSSYNTVCLPADFCCAPLSTTFFLFLSKLHFNTSRFHFNSLQLRGSYSATSNMELVHWPLMGGLLHLVQQGGDWVGPQPAQAPPRCTKYNSPPINGQSTNHCIAV